MHPLPRCAGAPPLQRESCFFRLVARLGFCWPTVRIGGCGIGAGGYNSREGGLWRAVRKVNVKRVYGRQPLILVSGQRDAAMANPVKGVMSGQRFNSRCVLFTVSAISLLFAGCPRCFAERTLIRLDGHWDVEQGGMDEIPAAFSHTVPVPGLIDMADPAFTEVGIDSVQRQAFWYRTAFDVQGPLRDTAMLMVRKAKYGMRLYLNGHFVADFSSCFTPLSVDVREHLRCDGQRNELIIRVGAFRTVLPATSPDGLDKEKRRYIPGIYDSVELVLSGSPFIQRVQAVPDIQHETVRLVADIRTPAGQGEFEVRAIVREYKSGKIAAESKAIATAAGPDGAARVALAVAIPHCRLWTPEDPFLYEVELATPGDLHTVRFGMRTFRFDPESGRAMLNDKVYYMRGTNVTVLRFFEDSARADLPWDKQWVRRLHQQFKQMNWNSIRYCIGFPPDFWYDIADEEGFLIQDEFPIWYAGNTWPRELKAEHLIEDFSRWMQHRWNHPCVVIWDAQNETISDETGLAIRAVRPLDLSNRPWDNGWSEPQSETDCIEAHPYVFMGLTAARHPSLFEKWMSTPRIPGNGPSEMSGKKKTYANPIIINEYGWLWVNRDGTPTRLSKSKYDILIGADKTADDYRRTYARYLAAKTEYWRAHRKCAGVLHFCGLGYSLPVMGETSDNFVDVQTLQFDPYFEDYVKDAFNPVGVMIDAWQQRYPADSLIDVPVYIINDLYQEQQGKVTLSVRQNDETLSPQTQSLTVPALGRTIVHFTLRLPAEAGAYELAAELIGVPGGPVTSLRSFVIDREPLTPQ